MFELLNRLRERPPEVRRTIAFATSGAITFVICLVWLGVLVVRHEPSLGTEEGGAEQQRFQNEYTSSPETPSKHETTWDDYRDMLLNREAAQKEPVRENTSNTFGGFENIYDGGAPEYASPATATSGYDNF